MGGGGLPQCMLGYTPPWADTPRHPLLLRTVRILLECILVIHPFIFIFFWNHINIVISQWQIQEFTDGRCAIPRGGESMNPLFGKGFPENCMKMKEIRPLWIHQCHHYERRTVFVTSNWLISLVNCFLNPRGTNYGSKKKYRLINCVDNQRSRSIILFLYTNYNLEKNYGSHCCTDETKTSHPLPLSAISVVYPQEQE